MDELPLVGVRPFHYASRIKAPSCTPDKFTMKYRFTPFRRMHTIIRIGINFIITIKSYANTTICWSDLAVNRNYEIQ